MMRYDINNMRKQVRSRREICKPEKSALPKLLAGLTLYKYGRSFFYPRDRTDFRQREAICFTSDGHALIVISEGENAGMYRLDIL